MDFRRYIVHPGEVISRSDGDIHFISFNRLCQLYGIHKEQAVNAGVPGAFPRPGFDGKDIHLWPLESGQYDEARKEIAQNLAQEIEDRDTTLPIILDLFTRCNFEIEATEAKNMSGLVEARVERVLPGVMSIDCPRQIAAAKLWHHEKFTDKNDEYCVIYIDNSPAQVYFYFIQTYK